MNAHNQRLIDIAAESGNLNPAQKKEHDAKKIREVQDFLISQFSYLGGDCNLLVSTIMRNIKIFKEEPMSLHDYHTQMIHILPRCVSAKAFEEWNSKINQIYLAMFKIVYPIRYEKEFPEEFQTVPAILSPIKRWLSENREELTKKTEWVVIELCEMFNKFNNSTYSIQRFNSEAAGCFAKSFIHRVNGKKTTFTTIIWDIFNPDTEAETKRAEAAKKRAELIEKQETARKEREAREEAERPAREKRYKLDEQIKLPAEELAKLTAEEFAEALAHFEKSEKYVKEHLCEKQPCILEQYDPYAPLQVHEIPTKQIKPTEYVPKIFFKKGNDKYAKEARDTCIEERKQFNKAIQLRK